LCWCLVWAGLGKHVADFAASLLRRRVEPFAVIVSGGVLKCPNVFADQRLGVRVGDCDIGSIAEIEAEWIDVACEKAVLSLVDLVEVLLSMALASSAVPSASTAVANMAEAAANARA
jgi:hypothetical protein